MQYKLIKLDELFDHIDQTQALAFDTETDGKYGKICLAQFYQRHWTEVLMIHNPEPIHLMATLIHVDSSIVMQNASYDISTIQRQTGSRFIPKKFDDTLLLARVHWPSLDNYSLDNLLAKALGFDPYRELGIDKKTMQKAKWTVPVIPPKQLEYAAIDVWYLLDLYESIKDATLSFSYQLDMASLREALDWQNNGMVVDKDALQEMYSKNLARLAVMNMPINVNSYQQVRPYIGSEMSDGMGLATLELKGNVQAAEVREARKLLKQNSFLNKFDTQEGKIYGIFGPYARSGRYTCSTQNLQQLPRATKGLFRCEHDRYMLYSDFSQLELRSITAITGDQRMVDTYREGGDIHNLVRDMLGISRQIAKTINFNGLYGGGAGMMRGILIKEAGLLMTHDAVAKELRKWKNLFRGVAAWQARGIRDFNAGRLGVTACGRQYRGRMMTDQLNIENQGTGAEVAKLAMHYMYPDLLANDCRLQNFVHDSYIVDSPNDEEIICIVSQRMAEAMQEAWFEVSQQLLVKDLPMPVSIYGGYNWHDIEAGSYSYKYEVN